MVSDKEKALIILKEAKEAFEVCTNEFRQIGQKFEELKNAMETPNDYLKRSLNEEENGGNIHKKCEYYNAKRDFCSNYLMGKYTGLAFEVSRHKECIKYMVEK